MNLLFVNSATASMWGGGEKWFTEAAQWFAEQGHTVTVVGRPGSRQLDAISSRGLDAIPFEFGGDYDPIASWRAGRLISRTKPDLILVNFNKDAWLFGRGAKLMRTPIVARHGLTLFRPKLVHHLVYRLHMDQVIVNARSIREAYEALGFDTGKVRVILNGVRASNPRPGALRDEFGIDPSTPLIVAAGRMDPQKRFDRFVRVAEKLGRDFPTAHFAILGDGSRHAEIEALARSTAIADRFHLPGFVVDYAEVACDADLFLLTSHNEGTPNVLLETMAAGVACVAFDVGAVPEVLQGFEDLVIEEGNEEAMYERARTLIADADQRASTAEALALLCRERLSFDHSMRQYEECFLALR